MQSGVSAPLGATVRPDGVNFSVFSKHAALIELLLFDDGDAARPSRVIPLDPRRHRTYHYWHAFVPGLERRTDLRLPRARDRSRRNVGCDSTADKVLLDPYGLAVAVPDAYDRDAATPAGRQRGTRR